MSQLALKIDNVLNPILVKELRQATNGKFVRSIIIGLTVLLFGSMAIALLAQGAANNTSIDAGKDLFGWFLGVLSFTVFLCIPNWTGNRFAAERTSSTMELLYASTIKPWQIISGKFMTGLIIAVQLYSICLPFMTICYLMRGIDVPAILLSTATSFIIFIPVLMVAIFIGSVPASRGLKIVLNVGFVIMIIWMTGASSTVFLFRGSTGMTSSDFWIMGASTVSICLVITGLFFVLAVAAISPNSANRALPVRSYISVVWLISGIVFSVLAFKYDEDFIMGWLIPFIFVAVAGMLVAASERDTHGTHIAKQIPRNGILRLVAFPHFSGAFNGILYFLTLAVLTFVLSIIIYSAADGGRFISNFGDHDIRRVMLPMFNFALYVFPCAIIAIAIKKRFFQNTLKKMPATFWGLIIVVVSIILPIVCILITYAGHMKDLDHYPNFFILSPIGAFISKARTSSVTFTLIFAVLIGLIALPKLLKKLKAFRKFEPKNHDVSDSSETIQELPAEAELTELTE